MRRIEFTVNGIPKGQPRPRAFTRGKHAGVYDPGTADEWKSSIRKACKKAWDGTPMIGGLCVYMRFYFQRPKSHFNKAGLRTTAPNRHTSRPDADNLAKAVLDALTDVGLWKDDAAVCILRASKLYTDCPGCHIECVEVER